MKKLELEEKYKYFVEVNWSSIDTRKSYMNAFYKFTNDNTVVQNMSAHDIRVYLSNFLNQYSDSYFNHLLKCLNIIYGKHILNQPRKLNGLSYKESSPKRYLVLSPKEVKEMIMRTENIKHKMIIKCLYVLGARKSEVVCIKLEHIDRTNNQILIKGGKGAKDRIIDVDTTFMNGLVSYYRWCKKKPSVFLFEGSKSGEMYSKSSVYNIVKRHSKHFKKKIWPHLLRHSIVSAMINEGVNLYKIKDFLGHRDIKTTERYYQYLKTEGMLSIAQSSISKAA